MANKRNQVKKKSALARRRAGKSNGMKGGYSGFRGYKKNPENKPLSQRTGSQNQTSRRNHTSEKDTTEHHEPYIIYLEVNDSDDSQKPAKRTRRSTGSNNIEAVDPFDNNCNVKDRVCKVKPELAVAVVNGGNTNPNKRRRKQAFQVRC